MGKSLDSRKYREGLAAVLCRVLHIGRWFARVKAARQRLPQRLAVYERVDSGWNVVEGEVGGTSPKVLRARVLTVQSGSEVLPGESAAPDAGSGTLVVRSQRAVCREMELPAARDEEVRSMITMRLETELPYALSESTWAYQPQAGLEGQGKIRVLLVTVPTADIVAQERELPGSMQPCDTVECRESALAQIAAVLAPGEETTAIAEIETGGATLVVARHGKLSYARHIFCEAADEGAQHLAGEIQQSLQHYTFDAATPAPQKLFLVGQDAAIQRVAGTLAQNSALPVEIPHPSDSVVISEAAGEPKRLLGQFAACIGALIAAHRRLCHKEVAAPPLRLARKHFRERIVCNRVALAAANVLLVLALIATSFGVRAARLRAATRAVKEVRPLLAGIEVLEEEIDILRFESRQERPAIDLLLALAEALPGGIVISDLTIDSRGKITIQGKAPSVEVASRAAAALSESELFSDAELSRTSKEKKEVVFRIVCVARAKGA